MLAPQSPWLTILLGALTAMTALGIDMSLPALPALAGAFGVGTDRIQLTLSLFILGYAGGQLIYGPLSDRFGRRPLLLIGTAVYMASGLACALSPSIEVLVVARFVQGLGGCAGPILARAVIRDHHSGRRASQMLSHITLVFALAPLVAPLIGAALLERFGWPAIFWCLAGFGFLLWLAIVVGFGESLRDPDPRAAEVTRMVANAVAFFANSVSLRSALVNGFVFAGLFAFISGSPFVLIDVYQVSPQHFGLYFALSALGLMLGAVTNSRLLRYRSGDWVMRFGLWVLLASGGAVLLIASRRWGGPLLLVAPIVAYVFAQGLVLPNAIAAAMEPLPHMAGMAASLVGAIQMIGGSLSGYAVNALYDRSPLPMAATIALMGASAFVARWLLPPKIS